MDPDPGPIGTQLLLLALLTMVNAFFACAEMAIVSVNKTKIGILADEGSRKAKTVQKLLQEPTRFLSTIQVAITLAGFFSSASAATGISEVLGAYLQRLGIPYGNQISFVGVTVIPAFLRTGIRRAGAQAHRIAEGRKHQYVCSRPGGRGVHHCSSLCEIA